MSEAHTIGAWVLVVGNVLAGGWALMAHRNAAWRGRPLWVATVVVQLTVFAQVALGFAVIARDDIEADDLHVFYGIVAALTVGVLYSYRHQLGDRVHLLYGFGGLFLAGLGIRAILLPPT
ncbi:MAG: hypothetical protein AAGD18_01655 [Actinomycetota bacterium]